MFSVAKLDQFLLKINKLLFLLILKTEPKQLQTWYLSDPKLNWIVIKIERILNSLFDNQKNRNRIRSETRMPKSNFLSHLNRLLSCRSEEIMISSVIIFFGRPTHLIVINMCCQKKTKLPSLHYVKKKKKTLLDLIFFSFFLFNLFLLFNIQPQSTNLLFVFTVKYKNRS